MLNRFPDKYVFKYFAKIINIIIFDNFLKFKIKIKNKKK